MVAKNLKKAIAKNLKKAKVVNKKWERERRASKAWKFLNGRIFPSDRIDYRNRKESWDIGEREAEVFDWFSMWEK